MATVRLSFSPFPVHVRTARLVGVAVARHAGVADATLDEVRLAIGEACSRAVALHRRHRLQDLIDVVLRDDDQFTVRVIDRAPVDVAATAPLPIRDSDTMEFPSPMAMFGDGPAADEPSAGEPEDFDTLTEEDVAVGMGLTLLVGLVDDLSVRPAPAGAGTEVEMSWPTGPHR